MTWRQGWSGCAKRWVSRNRKSLGVAESWIPTGKVPPVTNKSFVGTLVLEGSSNHSAHGWLCFLPKGGPSHISHSHFNINKPSGPFPRTGFRYKKGKRMTVLVSKRKGITPTRTRSHTRGKDQEKGGKELERAFSDFILQDRQHLPEHGQGFDGHDKPEPRSATQLTPLREAKGSSKL